MRQTDFGGGGDFGVPAFFGFEADPTVVADAAQGGEDLGEGDVAFAQELGNDLAARAQGILKVDVAKVAAERLGGVARGFTGAECAFDVPEQGGVIGIKLVEQFAGGGAGGPVVVRFQKRLGLVRFADLDDLAEVTRGHGEAFVVTDVFRQRAAEDSEEGRLRFTGEGGVAVGFVEHLLPALGAGTDERDRSVEAGDLEVVGAELSEGLIEIGVELWKTGDVDLSAQSAEVDPTNAGGGAGFDDLGKRPVGAREGGDREIHHFGVFISRGRFVKGYRSWEDSDKTFRRALGQL